MTAVTKRRETDLFIPLKTYLEGQGYSVHSEVHAADLLARRPSPTPADPDLQDATGHRDEVLVIETKLRITLKHLIQGVRRQEAADEVYLAIPLEGGAARVPNLAGIKTLLRRLGLGLLVVRFLRTGTRIEVLLHPGEGERRRRPARRRRMLREIDGRYAELNRAGEPSTVLKMTAYRQQCLLLAWQMRTHDAAQTVGKPGWSPAELRKRGAPERVGQLLSQNHYGWFDRLERGRYALSPEGRQALEQSATVVEQLLTAPVTPVAGSE